MATIIATTCLWLLLALAGGEAHAQTPTVPAPESAAEEITPLPDPLTREAIRDLVATLPDKDVRTLLIAQLDAAIAKAAEAGAQTSVFGFIRDTAFGIANTAYNAVVRLPRTLEALSTAGNLFQEQRGEGGVLWFFSGFALAIVIGVVAELALGGFARRWRKRITTEVPETFRETIGLLSRRMLLESAGLIAFTIATSIAIPQLMNTVPPAGALNDTTDADFAYLFLFYAIIPTRISLAVTRFLIAPNVPALRLLNCNDRDAKLMHRRQAAVIFLWGFNTAFIFSLTQLNQPMGDLLLGWWFNLAAYLLLFVTVWQARRGLETMMRGFDTELSATELKIARWYPPVSLVLIVINWLIVESIVVAGRFDLLDGRQNVTLLLLLYAPMFDAAIRGLARTLAPSTCGAGEVARAAHKAAIGGYIRIGRVLVFGFIVLFTAWLWKIDLSNVAAAGVGQRAAAGTIQALLTGAIAYIIWELTSLWINAKLAAERTASATTSEHDDGGEGGGAGGSRLSTVLPLARAAIKIAILVVAVLLALGELGVNIAPLLAGAGIAGLAIGFGAQKLVADVVSGVFFLLDDAFRTGEYLEVAGTFGTVERISIRSIQLRHHEGAVHTIPYGEMQKITNF
ncbi:MAG: mechanosensitive ion channel domain-containing protein, partial [Pseudomonadota bacterium]